MREELTDEKLSYRKLVLEGTLRASRITPLSVFVSVRDKRLCSRKIFRLERNKCDRKKQMKLIYYVADCWRLEMAICCTWYIYIIYHRNCPLQGPQGQPGILETPGVPGIPGTPGTLEYPDHHCSRDRQDGAMSGKSFQRRWKQCSWSFDQGKISKNSGQLHVRM